MRSLLEGLKARPAAWKPPHCQKIHLGVVETPSPPGVRGSPFPAQNSGELKSCTTFPEHPLHGSLQKKSPASPCPGIGRLGWLPGTALLPPDNRAARSSSPAGGGGAYLEVVPVAGDEERHLVDDLQPGAVQLKPRGGQGGGRRQPCDRHREATPARHRHSNTAWPPAGSGPQR